jgi:hypothetical protein
MKQKRKSNHEDCHWINRCRKRYCCQQIPRRLRGACTVGIRKGDKVIANIIREGCHFAVGVGHTFHLASFVVGNRAQRTIGESTHNHAAEFIV